MPPEFEPIIANQSIPGGKPQETLPVLGDIHDIAINPTRSGFKELKVQVLSNGQRKESQMEQKAQQIKASWFY